MSKHTLTAILCLVVALASIWLGSWLMSFVVGWVRAAVGLTMATTLFASAMVFLWNMLERRP
ncbi:hypothetical protein [Alicycliphilus denitrificans]|uniref:Uncharacterized protein n=1 Tax=Alicycliphilus denitrificans TaxID=179636 RepID=A0A3R7EDR5_9BURK|nr:hypothetical protein [Alicycliphilus denitrificans]RKJ96656.1 hypothetical protein CE154_011585 [Alicycliphilus denitrificans]